MRAALLVASALLLTPVTGHAQILTDSPSEDLQMLKDYAQSLKDYVVENSQWLEETKTDLNTAQTYLQLVTQYAAFVANPQLAVQQLLNQTGLSQDLPVSPMVIMSLANGFQMSGGASLGGDLAKLQMLSGFTNSAYSTAHVYTCTGTDPTCIDLNARANGIAGSMGIAQTGYADIQTHQGVITCLRADLAGTTDPAKRETILAQIGTEQLYIQNVLASLTAASMQSGLAQQSDAQRMTERQRASADAYFNATQPITGVGAVTGQAASLPPLFSAN